MSTQSKNTSIFRLGDLPKNVADRVVALPKDVATRGRDVWLAGLGALATVEEQGTTFFQGLVQQGEKLVETGGKLVEKGETVEAKGKARIESLTTDLSTRQGQVQKQVVDAVDNGVYEPVMEALKRLGVPTRAEIRELSGSVDVLTRRVNDLLGRMEADKAATVRLVFRVVAREDGWAVEHEGAERAVSLHPTKDEAVERARALANESKPSQLVILRKDGTIQDTFTYEA